MLWHFPKIKTTRTVSEQLQKILDEAEEFSISKSDEEAIDILHACETFIRLHFDGREGELRKLIVKVRNKNTKRGYYAKKCY